MPNLMKSINILHRAQAMYRTRRSADGFPAAHHTFVFAISANPGKTQDELAELLFLNKSTVARTLTALEERGLVRREPNPEDKRQLRVYPTEAMAGLRPVVAEIARDWNGVITEGISEEELAVFERVLAVMEKNADGALKKGGAEE